MRRLLAISAITVAMFAAFALAWQPTTARAASNPGNLTLVAIGNRYDGCPLGPAYTFCDEPSGTTSQAVPFFVSSSAAVTGASVSLQPVVGASANFAAADFTISGNSCAGNLASGAQCEVDLEFSPTTTGLREAALTITDAQGDSLAINIEGNGNNLALTPPYGANPGVADNSFNYGGEPVNQATVAQSFSISAGAAVTQIHLSLAAIPGLESGFASGGRDFVETDNCSALSAGGSCTANVEFMPTAVGLRAAALIATDAEGDTTTLYISGYGNNGRGGNTEAGGLFFPFVMPGTNSSVCARVNYFGFCNIPIGGISTASTFTVQNSSGAQITGLSVPTGSVIAQGSTAPDFTVQNTSCSSVLDSGASCNVTVAFTPTASGLRQGAVVITDAQGDVATVNLAGVGVDYSIAPELPTEVSVIPGGTAKFTATLSPDNVFGMNGEQVNFVCPSNLPTNTSCAVTPCPAMITPGTPVTVTVAIVTSSATTVAPVPTAGCSTYGPSQTAFIPAPPMDGAGPRASDSIASRGSPVGTALLILAALGAIGLLAAAFATPQIADSKKRVPLIFACAALAAAVLTGCHHHGATITTATPTGVTSLKILGSAIDANGNSLNTSRSFTVTLDVVTK